MSTLRKVGRDRRARRVRKSTNDSGAPGGRALPRQLLRDAAEWRLISLLFECPGKDWPTQVAGLAKEVSDPKLKSAAKAAGKVASESVYQTTFGPGGPAAPREVSHRETLMPGQMLEQLGAYYEAFAYRPSIAEPPDHIAVMTGFIAYLRLKEAFGNTEQAEITAKAARDFLDNHLNVIAEPLARSLAHSDISYLAQTAAALLERVGPRRTSSGESATLPVACPLESGCAFDSDGAE